jgi:hypothetical protein
MRYAAEYDGTADAVRYAAEHDCTGDAVRYAAEYGCTGIGTEVGTTTNSSSTSESQFSTNVPEKFP